MVPIKIAIASLKVAAIVLLLVALSTSSASAQATVILSGKLVDRQCSVEDVYQLQPNTEKRCTLWFEVSYSCPAGVCKSTYTIYCPNAAVDGRFLNTAYETCADPSAMQIRHPTKIYVIYAYPRTVIQQLDGYGQFTGYQFQY